MGFVEGGLWMGTWWKTSKLNEGNRGRKSGDQWKHPSPIGKLMSLIRGLCRWWKTSQPDNKKTEKENRIKDQSIKIFRTRWGNMGRKPNDHSYCWWKNLPTWTKNREGKTEIDEERKGLFKERLVWGGTYSRRDLFEEGLVRGGTCLRRDLFEEALVRGGTCLKRDLFEKGLVRGGT